MRLRAKLIKKIGGEWFRRYIEKGLKLRKNAKKPAETGVTLLSCYSTIAYKGIIEWLSVRA